MTPWVTRLLIANVAMYFLQQTLPVYTDYLVLRPAFVLYMPWTLFTYMFLHGSTTHLLFNMLGLFFFGPRIESRMGSRRFIVLWIVSGLTGGLLSVVMREGSAVVGASAAVYGIFLAFARYWPTERIYIWGILPIEARFLVIIMTVLSLWGGMGVGVLGSNIAHFAHLGGFLGGWIYLKWLERNAPTRKFKEKALVGTLKGRTEASDLRRWQSIPREELHPLNREEVDRLLRKIETGGVKSLTLEERASLDRFSREPS